MGRTWVKAKSFGAVHKVLFPLRLRYLLRTRPVCFFHLKGNRPVAFWEQEEYNTFIHQKSSKGPKQGETEPVHELPLGLRSTLEASPVVLKYRSS